MDGMIFNVERFAIHDGPGIRTVVFLKGCPLRCAWCSNPESQRPERELFHSGKKCLGGVVCGTCAAACPNGAVVNAAGVLTFRRELCVACGTCAALCPSRALEMQGRVRSSGDVLQELLADEPFYRNSGGGVTLSGGEPLLQAEFAAELLERCRALHLHTCVETAGHVPWHKLALAAPHVKEFLYDVKLLDSARHRAGTGVGSELILENLKRLSREFPHIPITVRTPVIPGFNDSGEDIGAIARFLAPLESVKGYDLLAYHSFGAAKYRALGRDYGMDETVRIPAERLSRLREIARLEQYR